MLHKSATSSSFDNFRREDNIGTLLATLLLRRENPLWSYLGSCEIMLQKGVFAINKTVSRTYVKRTLKTSPRPKVIWNLRTFAKSQDPYKQGSKSAGKQPSLEQIGPSDCGGLYNKMHVAEGRSHPISKEWKHNESLYWSIGLSCVATINLLMKIVRNVRRCPLYTTAMACSGHVSYTNINNKHTR